MGASPALPTLASSLILVLMHRALGWLCVRSAFVDRLIGGTDRKLYRDGQFDDSQMSAALLTRTDVREAARDKLHVDSLDNVDSALLERNGQISLILKSDPSDAANQVVSRR